MRSHNLFVVTFGLTIIGCSGSDSNAPPDNGVGGSSSVGGSTSGVGGSVATGGVGSKSTGGAPAAGGMPATGGSPATGGMPVTGGSPAAGGSRATGGMPATGGLAPGGSSSAGGASGTQGCGLANYPAPCSTSGSPCSIDVNGTARQYYVKLPSNYSASQAYPVVFEFHYLGGSAEGIFNDNMYNIRPNFANAIYVIPQGLAGSDGNRGWPNTNGQDVNFTKAMISSLESSYCIDTGKIFSAGFSYGGMMFVQRRHAILAEMARAAAGRLGAVGSGWDVRRCAAPRARPRWVRARDGFAAAQAVVLRIRICKQKRTTAATACL